MEFRVLETRQFGDLLLVVYDWTAFPDRHDIRNLYAYAAEGERLWIAEARRPGDFYTGLVGDGTRVQAATWDCFCCTLDPATGRITDTLFTK